MDEEQLTAVFRLIAASRGLRRAEQALLLESAAAAPKINATAATFTHVGTVESLEISEAAMVASKQKFTNAMDILKPYTKIFMPEQEARNLLSMQGIDVPPRPAIIPERFKTRICNTASGIVYKDPLNNHNEIRVMGGKLHSPNQAQRNPYVKVQIGGKKYDKFGNILNEKQKFESHIPYHEFNFEIFTKVIK